jgi:hypothetical protein
MAAFGGLAALINLALGGLQAALPLTIWGAVCIVGIIIVAKHPSSKK